MSKPTAAAKAADKEIEKYYSEMNACANFDGPLPTGDRPVIVIQRLLDAEIERLKQQLNKRVRCTRCGHRFHNGEKECPDCSGYCVRIITDNYEF